MEVALGSGCPAYSGSVLVIADVGARGGAGAGTGSLEGGCLCTEFTKIGVLKTVIPFFHNINPRLKGSFEPSVG